MTKKRLRLFGDVKRPGRADGVSHALQQAFPVHLDEGDEAMQRLIDRLKAFEGARKRKGEA